MADSLSLTTLDTRLQEAQGDYLSFATTTNIGAGVTVISTTLRQFDYTTDDYFNEWWIYIDGTVNIGVERRVSDYATATGTITVYGANLGAEGGAMTCYLSRYRRTDRVKALNDTLRELYPNVHKRIDNRILITNNYLPNGHFEDQATTGTPDKWAFSTNASGTAETTIIRGGAKSVKVTAAAATVYMKLTTTNYPRLLDLSGQTVTVKVWAYSSVADDAFIKIYTKDKAGTTQTLASTTTCVANTWTQLVLEDQVLNDDLVDCEIWLFIKTNLTVVYFDDARLIAVTTYEYLLPTELDDGKISNVFTQSGGYYESGSDDVALCDSLFGQTWEEVHDYSIINDGTNKWLRLDSAYVSERRIRLIGTAPFTSLSAATDAIVFDQEKVPMLVAYAKYNFFNRLMGTVSSEDTGKYQAESAKAYAEYMRLSSHRMGAPSRMMNLPRID